MVFPYISLVVAVVIPIHLAFEGLRWQMIPTLLYSLGFILLDMIQYYRSSKKEFLIANKGVRITTNLFFLIIYFAIVTIPILLPIVNLPEPGGPFTVGTKSFRMIDYDRKELFTKDSLDLRKLLVTTWYPAELEKGKTTATYWDKKGHTGKVFSMNAGMGRFWYSHLSLVKTNSYPEAAFSSEKGPFPVIIYSPSFYGLNTENTMLFEELASHGYIIFSIAHSYETAVSVYPDDEVVPGDLEYISSLFDSHADKEWQFYQDYKNADQIENKTALLKQILAVDKLSNQLVKTRRQDAIYVLDAIEKLNHREGIYKSKLDLTRIGIMGWSFGGAAAVEACIADNRFKAGINIDGWPYGELINSDKHISQPYMMIQSESEDEMESIISDIVIDKVDHTAYTIMIKNTTHMNFYDFPLFFKIYQKLGHWGPMDPLRLLAIESVYIKGFFDKHLKGDNTGMLEGPSELFPEITIEAGCSPFANTSLNPCP